MLATHDKYINNWKNILKQNHTQHNHRQKTEKEIEEYARQRTIINPLMPTVTT